MMNLYDTDVTYLTAGGHTKHYRLGGLLAETRAEAKTKARESFDGYRQQVKKKMGKAYVDAVAMEVEATFVREHEELVVVDAASPAPVAGLVEKSDLLEQIKVLVGAQTADPRIGKVVCKTGGDYEFDGVIVGVVTKLSGAERFVVEDSRGLLLIMNASQVGF